MPKTKTSNQATPLQGKELLKKVKELSHLSRRKKAIECGYYSVGNNKQPKAKIAEFLEAILEAVCESLGRSNFAQVSSRSRAWSASEVAEKFRQKTFATI